MEWDNLSIVTKGKCNLSYIYTSSSYCDKIILIILLSKLLYYCEWKTKNNRLLLTSYLSKLHAFKDTDDSLILQFINKYGTYAILQSALHT